jgi:5'-3' exonuclease
MILLDNNQIILASIFVGLKNDPNVTEDLIRHQVLNSYRMIRRLFNEEYGELVICQDSSNSWRKQYFPQYKANRSKSHSESEYDWDEIYRILNIVRDEVRDNFPYKNMRVENCEADDIIAVLVKNNSHREKIVIVSNDKDFQQLQVYPNVKQYSTMKKEFLECRNPKFFLLEHILRGDSSDGIPNILSDDDVFVEDQKRQNRLTAKRIEQMMNTAPRFEDHAISRNWDRNSTLIDFTCIPQHIENRIMEEYEKPTVVSDRSKVLPYMINNKLKNLISVIEEF